MGVGWDDIPKEYKPDWRVWKVEGTPYEHSQKRLAKIGLSDPWARNNVWTFVARKKSAHSLFKIMTRGWKGGVVLCAAILAVEKLTGWGYQVRDEGSKWATKTGDNDGGGH